MTLCGLCSLVDTASLFQLQCVRGLFICRDAIKQGDMQKIPFVIYCDFFLQEFIVAWEPPAW